MNFFKKKDKQNLIAEDEDELDVDGTVNNSENITIQDFEKELENATKQELDDLDEVVEDVEEGGNNENSKSKNRIQGMSDKDLIEIIKSINKATYDLDIFTMDERLLILSRADRLKKNTIKNSYDYSFLESFINQNKEIITSNQSYDKELIETNTTQLMGGQRENGEIKSDRQIIKQKENVQNRSEQSGNIMFNQIPKFDPLTVNAKGDYQDVMLIVDRDYLGDTVKGASADALSNLMGVGVSAGFRPRAKEKRVNSEIKIENIAYLVLYTTGEQLEWPNVIDRVSGVFVYYGDNREAGNDIHDRRGNNYLKEIFDHNKNGKREKIPPIFVFENVHEKYVDNNFHRSTRFLGLVVPGTKNGKKEDDLIAIWREGSKGRRFQNYKARFSFIDVGGSIDRRWLNHLYYGEENSIFEPKEWAKFVNGGIEEVKLLHAPKLKKWRDENEQMPKKGSKNEEMLFELHSFFIKMGEKIGPRKFEEFCIDLIRLMDESFDLEITNYVKDGGRDAIGKYKIGGWGNYLEIKCAMESKLYNPIKSDDGSKKRNSVGVGEISRLLARIRDRHFGILVTTSFVARQAYRELIEDDWPIMIIAGNDIINILMSTEYNDPESLRLFLEKYN